MRTIGRLITSAVLLLLTGALSAAAVYLSDLFFLFYTDFSRDSAAFLAGITNPFPFAVWEVLLLILILVLLGGLFRSFAKKRGFLRWVAGVVLLASVLAFLFVGLWGVNHFAPSVTDRLGLTVEEYSRDQLLAATRYFAEQASHWAEQVPRDELGEPLFDFDSLAAKSTEGYDVLAKHNEFFRVVAGVKPLAAGELFSYLGVTGIYSPYTGEAAVNPNTYPASIPFTMCHELAHSLTVAPEDEANFCAFLACVEHSDPAYRYSGWYSAFVYTYNALSRIAPEAAAQVGGTLSESLHRDCANANTHYDRYEGEVQDAARKVNDAYLKAFREEDGIQSYGAVADLLIAWYLQNQP